MYLTLFHRFLDVLDSVAKQMRNSSALGNILSLLNDKAYFVTKFHNELREGLNSAAKIYLEDHDDDETWQKAWETKENIGDVFVGMKARFLVYAPFIVMCTNVQKMLGVLKCDTNIKNEVEDLEKRLMQKMNDYQDFQRPTTFNSLLSLPFQHVLRYVTSLIIYIFVTTSFE